MKIIKKNISELFRNYLIELKEIDIELGQETFNHVISQERNASETQLYNNYYTLRFQKIIMKYFSEILKNADMEIPIVDFGGGTGVLSIFLASLGYQVIVWDIDNISLNICKGRAAKLDLDIDVVKNIPKIDHYNLISFFSIRQSALNGASIQCIAKNANNVFMIDTNERYFLHRLFIRKYGLRILEIDEIFLKSGLFLSKRFGACLMPKQFSFFEPERGKEYPLLLSTMYFASYSKKLE